MRILTAYLSKSIIWAISESLYPSILISKISRVSLSAFLRISNNCSFPISSSKSSIVLTGGSCSSCCSISSSSSRHRYWYCRSLLNCCQSYVCRRWIVSSSTPSSLRCFSSFSFQLSHSISALRWLYAIAFSSNQSEIQKFRLIGGARDQYTAIFTAGYEISISSIKKESSQARTVHWLP